MFRCLGLQKQAQYATFSTESTCTLKSQTCCIGAIGMGLAASGSAVRLAATLAKRLFWGLAALLPQGLVTAFGRGMQPSWQLVLFKNIPCEGHFIQSCRPKCCHRGIHVLMQFPRVQCLQCHLMLPLGDVLSKVTGGLLDGILYWGTAHKNNYTKRQSGAAFLSSHAQLKLKCVIHPLQFISNSNAPSSSD